MYNIDTLLSFANNDNAMLDGKALSMRGMSSSKVRRLLNKAVSFRGAKYLEIGVWHGSTFYSALCNNNPEYAIAIDDFSQFSGNFDIFSSNMSDIKTNYSFFNCDCFKFDKSLLKNSFNIYFYDGGHTKQDQEQALTYYYECMDETFMYICDDFNWVEVQEGTESGIKKCNLKVIDSRTILTNKNGCLDGFWNGIYIGILQK
jgi:hypothetical protein